MRLVSESAHEVQSLLPLDGGGVCLLQSVSQFCSGLRKQITAVLRPTRQRLLKQNSSPDVHTSLDSLLCCYCDTDNHFMVLFQETR